MSGNPKGLTFHRKHYPDMGGSWPTGINTTIGQPNPPPLAWYRIADLG
jgi:hypothetical protein